MGWLGVLGLVLQIFLEWFKEYQAKANSDEAEVARRMQSRVDLYSALAGHDSALVARLARDRRDRLSATLDELRSKARDQSPP